MPNPAQVLPTDRELRQSIRCLLQGTVPWQGLLYRGLTVQVVSGQCLHHAGTISYHGHHLLLRHGKVQILALEQWVPDLLEHLPPRAYLPKWLGMVWRPPFSPVSLAGSAHGQLSFRLSP